MAPDHLRGRIMSFHTMMFFGTAPLGSLLAGAITEKLGAPLTVAAGGLLCACAYVLFWTALRKFDTNARELQKAHGGAFEAGETEAVAGRPQTGL